MALLFHGSPSKFNFFNPKLRHSGEGVGDFPGWYFIRRLYGAYYHCSSILQASPGEAFVYVCEVPDKFTVENCEGGYTDSAYQCQSTGVLFENSAHIRILEIHEYSTLLAEASLDVRQNRKYKIGSAKRTLAGGAISHLELASHIPA